MKENNDGPVVGLSDAWKALITSRREMTQRQILKTEDSGEAFRGPTITSDVKWSTEPGALQDMSVDRYVYLQLANVTEKVGTLEMVIENQDSMLRALSRVIARLVDLGAIDAEELPELISDYRHTVKLTNEETTEE